MADRHVGSGQTYETIQAAADVAVAGDNIIVHAGTYAEQVTPANNGTSGSFITLKPNGTDKVIITGADPTDDYSGTCLNLSCNYWHIEDIYIEDHNWENTGSGYITSDDTYYWCYINGTGNELTRCYIQTDPTVDNVWDRCKVSNPATNELFNRGRLIGVAGSYNVIQDCYLRGGSQGILVFGGKPNKVVIQRNTFTKQLWNNIFFALNAGAETTYAQTLIQYNTVLDNYGEDNIQFSHAAGNFDPENPGDYEHHNRGVIVRGNIFRKAGENAFDLKACGATTCFEDNIIVESYGSDDGWQPYPRNNQGPNDNGGCGFEVGYGDSSQYAIIRNNIIGTNHGAIYFHNGYHLYGCTIYNNRHSYRGYESSDGYYSGMKTDNTYRANFPDTKKVFINNIIYGQTPSGFTNTWNLWVYSQGTKLEMDYNLYFTPYSSGRWRVIDGTWPAEKTLTTLQSWQQHLEDNTDGDYDDWVGRPVTSRAEQNSMEGNPLFTNFVPLTSSPGEYDPDWDFTLAPSSPASASNYPLSEVTNSLTTATNAGSEDGVLEVRDSYFFHDGYGIPAWYGTGKQVEPNDPSRSAAIEADWIVIGPGEPVQIHSIDYSGESIVLCESRSWEIGDDIYLARYRDGAYTKVKDIGYRPFESVEYEEQPDTFASQSLNWKYKQHFVTIEEDTTIKFFNLNSRDIMVVLKNPNGYEVRWQDVTTWLSNPPDSHLAGTHWFTFLRDQYNNVYGSENK